MKTCNDCYWFGKCPDQGTRCEYYDSIYGNESIVSKEYETDLKMRVNEYDDIVKEQQST